LKDHEEHNKERAQELIPEIEHTPLREVVSGMEICFDPDDLNTLIEEDRETLQQYHEFETMVQECMEQPGDDKQRSNWIIRMALDKEALLDRKITMEDINFAIANVHGNDISCVYSDYNSEKLVFRLRVNQLLSNKKLLNKINPLDQSDEIYILKNFQDQLLDNIILRGVKGIEKVVLRKIADSLVLEGDKKVIASPLNKENGKFVKRETWVLDTKGSNLIDVLALDYINTQRTYSNDIREMYRTFGIEAARMSIMNELSEVLAHDSTYINYHHLALLCDRMTYSANMISIFRNGINNDNIGPIAKASFEETPEMFLRAARHGELDIMRGVSANVMCGQEGYFGTNSFQLYGDLKKMSTMKSYEYELENEQDYIEKSIGFAQDIADKCSAENIAILNNVVGIKQVDLGDADDDDYNMNF
jgi:DNA-directed RNA polymerase II subunit RPB1